MKWLMKTLVILIILSTTSFSFAGGKTYGNVEVSKIISVYDGDTFRADIKYFPDIIGKNMGIRIYGIDTPEMRDKRKNIKALAVKARDYVRGRLLNASKVTLKNLRRGKYFRLVAEVWVDGKNISNELIANGLAKPYYGKKKVKW